MDLDDRLRRAGWRPSGDCRDGADVISLIGLVEPSFWPVFTGGPEYGDGQPNPLDRWWARVISGIAAACHGIAAFPFGRSPHAPFQRWTRATRRARPVGGGTRLAAQAAFQMEAFL